MRMILIAVFLMFGISVFAQSNTWSADSYELNSVIISNWTDVTALSYASDRLTQYAKHHNTNTAIFAAADTWQDIEFNFSPPTENSFGITLSTNDNKTISFDFAGHMEVNGCLRPEWTGNPTAVVSIASRIIYSIDSWATTNEARCLQAYDVREKMEEEIGMLPYHGSLTVATNTQIRLQGRVGDTNLILRGWSGFDRPTSATINMFCVGKGP